MSTTRKQASAERRQQIIDAALRVFAEKGFRATTNRDIAEAADINSPGLIYHYFESQEALFQAVLQERAPVFRLAMNEAQDLMVQPPRVVLTHLAQTLMETVSDPTTQSMMRLTMGEALRQQDVFDMVYEGAIVHLLTFLYQYVEHLMELGELRRADPGATVRLFIGPLFVYIFTTFVLGMKDPKAPDSHVLIETTVDTFLRGMAPEPA